MRPNSSINPYYGSEEEEVIVDADAALMDDDPHNPAGTRRQVGGAAALGGIAGLIAVGPLVGVIAAGGAAAVAATSRGQAGQVARKSGDLMADAGVRLQRFDRKHHVVERTSKGVKKGCHWVTKQFNTTRQKPEVARSSAGQQAQTAF